MTIDESNLTREKILLHAVRLSAKKGYREITRDDVAGAAKVAPALVSYYFESMTGLRNAVMREAIQTNNLAIVAQGLVAKNRIARAAPAALRVEAATLLAG